ncbi:polysaccharide deacetylase family protein [Geobacter sp. DSM 9736]|uniref:polysaccharide deacetylase family protein n=1 Tax=Geobacter sp. DSM 9736 TaxID=1277350 RepID=UPI000B51088F|nr:polysaccharide deacetylase family protein [Geobacter sp. DSM 9736]SNB47637.1 polysaccharide deacetylase family protein, PEP-CTERM locus subfamily [Geobacter sp. DSM 9736]
MPVLNALTIDVEDWYHVCDVPGIPVIPDAEKRVRRNVELILDMLRAVQVRATFFILGSVAQDEPDLVPKIVAEGHEIASHGWSHTLVSKLTPEAFRSEIVATADILERQGGRRPSGFRAPQWSLCRSSTSWAFSILREEGFRYDSSLNPLPFVGNPCGPRQPFGLDTAAGRLVEFPPLVMPTCLGNLPVGGGWGFRFFPYALVKRAINRLNNAGYPAVLYLHPREIDPAGPRLGLSPVKKFAAYGPRSDASERLRKIFLDFSFTSLDQLVQSCNTV